MPHHKMHCRGLQRVQTFMLLFFILICSVNCGTLHTQICVFLSYVDLVQFATGELQSDTSHILRKIKAKGMQLNTIWRSTAKSTCEQPVGSTGTCPGGHQQSSWCIFIYSWQLATDHHLLIFIYFKFRIVDRSCLIVDLHSVSCLAQHLSASLTFLPGEEKPFYHSCEDQKQPGSNCAVCQQSEDLITVNTGSLTQDVNQW